MKLRLQNVGQATVVIKDLQGYSPFVGEVEGGHTEDYEVTEDVLQRIAPQLRDLESSVIKDDIGNVLVGFRWSVLADGADDRAQTEGLAGLPNIVELQAVAYDNSSGLTDAIATGTGLLGNQVKATTQLFSGAKRLDVAAVLPGAPGNSLSAAIGTPTGTGSPAVSVVGGLVTVTPIAVGNTVAELAAAINADATAKLMVKATVGVAGSITAAVAAKALTGGIGAGVSLTMGGTACVIKELLTDKVTFDAPTGISAASRIVPLDYRNGPHLSRLSVPVVA
jgi:hypothetical protein